MDLSCGKKVPLCLTSAAAVHGFDTEGSADLHVLNPPGCQLRSVDGLVVHRRDGAPLTVVAGRYVTAPAWTAIEVARALRRPRALATLDAALRSGTCSRTELWRAATEQAGRRGIVAVRNLIALADERAESLMDIGWIVIAIVFEDVRHRGGEMVARINAQLSHARAA